MSEALTALTFDGSTGEVTERPLTADEISQHKAIRAEAEAEQAAADAKVAARESALAKLAALGLTADEVAAL